MINEALKELYKKHHSDGKVIPGGVFNEEKYLLSKPRIMMLMKEVNDPSEKYDWTLPSLLKAIYTREEDCSFYRMWKNVSRWSICVQNPEISYNEINDNYLYEGLKIFATTNLKKSGGKGQSNYGEVYEHAILNKEEWTEEINIMNPELIVCAGTFDIVKDIYEVGNNILVCKSGARYFVLSKRIYLDFVHPAYQVSDKLMFAYFKETFKCLLEQDYFHIA